MCCVLNLLSLFHLGLMLPDNEPEPVHGDGDDGQGGHEGGQARERADES